MKRSPGIFVDSDVVISSLISKSGASYSLIHEAEQDLYISDISLKELEIVTERLKLDKNTLYEVVKEKIKTVKIGQTPGGLKNKYKNYVLDINDAHIIGGAVAAKAGFIISYNIRHFKPDKIKTDFNILLTTPARFLQYLRSV